jgi:hypothetical protein
MQDLDEIVPRETGRDAQLAKKQAARVARRERDVSPGWWLLCGCMVAAWWLHSSACRMTIHRLMVAA